MITVHLQGTECHSEENEFNIASETPNKPGRFIAEDYILQAAVAC